MKTRGSYAVGRRRREDIIETATALIEEHGYYRTSMLEVAQRVGISESGVMHYFPTKRHLLLAIAQHRLDSDAEWWAKLPESVDGFAVFGQMVEASRRHAAQPGLIELFVVVSAEAADTGSAAHELFKARYERAVSALSARLRRGLTREGYSEVDFDELARNCIAISDGLQLQWVISDGAIDLESDVREHVERIKRSIVQHGPSSTASPVVAETA